MFRSGHKMIEVEVTKDMAAMAQDKTAEMGQLNNSITSGKGNFAGFIGEQIALHIIGGRWENTYEYDIVSDSGMKIDVKTKQTSVKPKEYYECSVADYNTSQKCNAYAFVRVKNTFDVGWFLGYMPKNEYYKLATHFNKGDFDPSNNYTFKASCYNLPINQLRKWS